jgi:Zn-dependent protease
MAMLEFLLIIIVLFFSVMVHEYAHGLAALLFGDDTAKRAGRLSLNIARHIDLMGTIIVPLILLSFYLMSGSGIIFGWAKPVPVSAQNLRNPARDYALVSVAGPLSNILLAFAFGFAWAPLAIISLQTSAFLSVARFICFIGVKINIILALFNLIPLPPLDGSNVVSYLLPYPLSLRYRKIARYGILVILILILTDTLRYPLLLADYLSRAILDWMYRVGSFLG